MDHHNGLIMNEEQRASIEAQIARQEPELAAYKEAIAATEKTIEGMEAQLAPNRARITTWTERIAELNAQITNEQAVIDAAMPAINTERSKLDALTGNAAAVESAILGCKTLLG